MIHNLDKLIDTQKVSLTIIDYIYLEHLFRTFV